MPLLYRTFELPLSGGSTPGDYPITGTTTTSDSNPANDPDTVGVRLEATCADPTGTGTRPPCPTGTVFSGPSNKTLSSSSDFEAQCCVRGHSFVASTSSLLILFRVATRCMTMEVWHAWYDVSLCFTLH
jgi:hypothetical protein